MKWTSTSRGRWIVILVLFLLIELVLRVEDILEGELTIETACRGLLTELLVQMVVVSILFLLYRSVWNWLKEHLIPRDKERWWKFIYAISFFIIILIPLILISSLLTNSAPDQESFYSPERLYFSPGIIILIDFFLDTLERGYLLEIQNDKLAQYQDQAKYQALANQLNPHFLFNSLNVLSYLVYEDQEAAEQFIDELSNIYRYTLKLKDNYLVHINEELEFVHSYMFLQKIRFPKNLSYSIETKGIPVNGMLPPLTLEVLVENAIKHNIIDHERPLNIEISIDDDYITIRNNYQPREDIDTLNSHKIGLKNLIEKYQILESELPTFEIRDNCFVAQVPIIMQDS